MRSAILNTALLIALAFLTCSFTTLEQPSAKNIVARYHELPKGVVFEGSGDGMEPFKTVVYDKDKNSFTINGTATYANPVTAKEFVKLFKSIKKDDRLGVTLVAGEAKTYGNIDADDTIAKNWAETDRLLGGIIYGRLQLLGDLKLPGGYVPKQAPNRKVPMVAFTNFTNYKFAKDAANKYHRSNMNIVVMLIPLADNKSSDGGHLPDEAALKNYVMEETDKANIDQLSLHQDEYLKIPTLGQTANYGEAAAFARLILASKIDQDAFLKQF